MYARLVSRVIRKGYAQAVAGDPRLLLALAADDVEFSFPGRNSFGGVLHGKVPLGAWMVRFASLNPKFVIHDVIVSGAPWHMRIAVIFTDSIGDNYRNDGVEILEVRWGKLRSVIVHLDTERVSEWETLHPETVVSTLRA